jgi:hypothetical protein
MICPKMDSKAKGHLIIIPVEATEEVDNEVNMTGH